MHTALEIAGTPSFAGIRHNNIHALSSATLTSSLKADALKERAKYDVNAKISLCQSKGRSKLAVMSDRIYPSQSEDGLIANGKTLNQQLNAVGFVSFLKPNREENSKVSMH